MAMMAITTSSSIKVKPGRPLKLEFVRDIGMNPVAPESVFL
jgi:hypothetical protein